MSKCPTCGHAGKIVNECRCDPNNLPTRVRDPQLAHAISVARYAKGMMAVRCPGVQGLKTTAGLLADVLARGRYTHREHAYIMSPAAARKFEALLAAGWSGQCIGSDLIAPDGTYHHPRSVRVSSIGVITICPSPVTN